MKKIGVCYTIVELKTVIVGLAMMKLSMLRAHKSTGTQSVKSGLDSHIALQPRSFQLVYQSPPPTLPTV